MTRDDEQVIVRRRDDGALELRVNGVFVMDDQETQSETLLAEHVLAAGAREILVGGLGLGFTTRALLDGGATRVVVAELHGAIVEAMRSEEIPGADLLADQRVTVEVGDVRDVIESLPPESLDAIVLDVDNGPDFLVHDENADLYRAAFIEQCAAKLRPSGHLSYWSMDDSTSLRELLHQTFAQVDVDEVPVQLGSRSTSYWVLTGSERILDNTNPTRAPTAKKATDS